MIYRNKQHFITDVLAWADKWDWSKPLLCKLSELKRKESQSAAFHSMCGEIAAQATWDGLVLTKDQWKHLLVSAHEIATRDDIQTVKGIEGELVNLTRESTSSMSVRRMSSLIDYVSAWAAGNGVVFILDDSYMQYPEAQKYATNGRK